MRIFETESQNYYEILDVRSDASPGEIRQAYFRAKAAYAKDSAALYSLFDEQETRLVLESIEQAYLVLSNPDKRKEYDRVHGFLGTSEDFSIPSVQKPPISTNVFSFSAGAGSEIAATQPEPKPKPVEPSKMPERSSASEDYSTPRTLSGHAPTTPTPQEYDDSSANFDARENRLGIVRRIDLVKPYNQDPAMEEVIGRELSFRGEFFRKVREYKSISVEELSEFTKISRAYINCIESEEFENLPAPAYLRGFITQIAKALKLPHEKAASAYMDHYKNTVLK